MSITTGDSMPELPELLEVLDVDALPDAFTTGGQVSIKVAGKRCVVNVSSDGVEDVARRWRRKNPRPLPTYFEKQVLEGSELAAKLGHVKGLAMVKVYDEKCPAYEQALEEWAERHNLVIVAHALKFEIRKAGQPITDLDERAAELKRMGMTSSMAAQIVATLTQMMVAEMVEAVRFFGDGSGSGG